MHSLYDMKHELLLYLNAVIDVVCAKGFPLTKQSKQHN